MGANSPAARHMQTVGLLLTLLVLAAIPLMETVFHGLDEITNEDYTFYLGGMRIANGELPLRDFTFFPYDFILFTSYVMRAIFGHHLMSDFAFHTALNVGSVVLIGYAAYRASRSLWATWLAAALVWAIDIRLFNSFKAFCLALALLAVVVFVERPAVRRALPLAAAVAVATYLRIDLGFIAAITAGAVILAAGLSRGLVWTARVVASTTGAYALLMAPFLLYVAMFGGVSTILGLPSTNHGSVTWLAPSQSLWDALSDGPDVTPVAPPEAPSFRTELIVSLDLRPEQVPARLGAYGLTDPDHVRTRPDGHEFMFTLTDLSPQTLKGLLADDAVLRVRGVDPETYRADLPPARTLSLSRDLLGVHVGTDFPVAVMYLVQGALVLACLAMGVARLRHARRARNDRPTGPPIDRPEIWVGLALLSLLAIVFMNRLAVSPARLQDGMAPFALAAALLTVGLWRSCRSRAVRGGAVVVVGGLMGLVVLLGEADGKMPRFFGIANDPARLEHNVSRTLRYLRARPIDIIEDQGDAWQGFAVYLHRCLGPDQRPFFPTYAIRPAYFAERLPAGRHHRIFPLNAPVGKFTDADTADAVRAQDAPVAFARKTMKNGVYFPLLDQTWPAVAELLREDYVEVEGTTAAFRAVFPPPYTIWVRKDAAPRRLDPVYGLPCFTDAP